MIVRRGRQRSVTCNGFHSVRLGAPRWSRLFVASSVRPQLARRCGILATTNSITAEAAPRRTEVTSTRVPSQWQGHAIHTFKQARTENAIHAHGRADYLMC